MPPPTYGFLPDFCANQTALLVVLIAELLAIVLAFASTDQLAAFWLALGLISLFIQWIALGSIALLCACRRLLNRLPVHYATLAVYGLAQLVTLLFSLLAIWVLNDLRLHSLSGADGYFLLRNVAVSSIVTLMALRYFYVQQQWKQNLEAQTRAQLQALQARIRPHFLFNSLNTIANLTRSAPERAEDAILDLADLFRFSLAQRETIPLQEELDIIRRYLHIETLRLGDRLRINWQLAADLPLDSTVPALMLQPLVENAIYHGIQPLTAGGTVLIRIVCLPNSLHFTVSNPLPPPTVHRHSGNRVAQDNIRQRLALAYGADSHFRIDNNNDTYTVSFLIPRETGS